MKKILAAAFLAMLLVLPMFAEESGETKKPVWDHGYNVSELYYKNVTIYRVLDQKDAYIVLYAKHGVGIGQAVIPKKWAKETPRKLAFRTKPGNIDPFMTVITKNGEFYKVWLTLPISKANPVWGVAPYGATVSGTDADTLDLEY